MTGRDAVKRVSVSVVIPVKDDAAALRVCLQALAAQTAAPHEIIVVDNGSTDDSAAVARAGGARVVTCLYRGIPAASSTGYDVASADVIARLDADSVPAPTWLAAITEAFRRHPEVDVLTGGAIFVDGPAALRRSLAVAYLGAYYLLTLPLLGHLTVFGSNMAMRTSAWEAVRFAVHRRDASAHDDLDLAFHLGTGHVIRFEPRLKMGISMRPFFDLTSALVRAARAIHTVLIHVPFGVAPLRWLRLAPMAVAGLRSSLTTFLDRRDRVDPLERTG